VSEASEHGEDCEERSLTPASTAASALVKCGAFAAIARGAALPYRRLLRHRL